MPDDESLAQYAALFLQQYNEEVAATEAIAASAPLPYPGITPLANELLQAVDAGGVPAFITEQLKQIALENGIAVTEQTTPNQIVAAIRLKTQG